MNKTILTLFAAVLLSATAHAQLITTVAGTDTAGYNGDSIAATVAKLHYPQSVATDLHGNLYIGDIGNNRIRRVDAATAIITTYGGNGTPGYSGDGGPATAAQLNAAYMTIDNLNNLYFTDPVYNRVRVISPDGMIRCVAGTGSRGYAGDGGPATAAYFDMPSGLATDDTGNIYIADLNNNRIRKVTYRGVISTIAGGGTSGPGNGGPALAAQLSQPEQIAMDQSNNLFVCTDRRVRKIGTDGMIATVAGKDTFTLSTSNMATANYLISTSGITTDVEGNIYLVVGNRITSRSDYVVKITPSGNYTAVTSALRLRGYAGDGGPATAAAFSAPEGLATDKNGGLYIADYYNDNIRKITYTNLAVDNMPVSDNDINIYPNPADANGAINIVVRSAANEEANVQLMTMTGRAIANYTMLTNKTYKIAASIPAGNYLVTVATPTTRWCRQVVIK